MNMAVIWIFELQVSKSKVNLSRELKKFKKYGRDLNFLTKSK